MYRFRRSGYFLNNIIDNAIVSKHQLKDGRQCDLIGNVRNKEAQTQAGLAVHLIIEQIGKHQRQNDRGRHNGDRVNKGVGNAK